MNIDFLEYFYHLTTVRNLNQILEEIHIYSDSDAIERNITNKELDIPAKPFVYNNRFIIDLSKYVMKGTKMRFISILPKFIPNTSLEIVFIDKVYKNWGALDLIFMFYLKVTLAKRYLLTSRREQIPNIMTIEDTRYELVYSTEIR